MIQKRRQEDDRHDIDNTSQSSSNSTETSYPVVHKISKSVERLLERNQTLTTIIERKEQELKEIKSQLTQAAKLAELGTLGASVAHELNNPLTVVAAEADDLLDTSVLDPESVRKSAQNIKSCATRMQTIVDYIRSYARDDNNEKWAKVNLNQIVDNALVLLRRQLQNSGISVELNLQNPLPEIWGHSSQLESVIQNLLSNSRDALKAVTEKRSKQVSIRTAMTEDHCIRLTISDNGCGMSQKIKKQLFKPFFTTKPAGKGTGLGMAIILGIIGEHNGNIKVRSQENKGTTFTITLPQDRRTVSDKRNVR
jgi:C4-dicarboxylate-specific signal transduction histidine kinase